MRKINTVLIPILLCIGLNAKDLKLNEAEEIEKFYYNKGYEAGFKKAFNQGYEEAYIDFRKKLRKYKNRLEAIEAGKYLNKEAKLQYPEVYRIRKSDGSYIVKIVPPKISGELSLKELAKIPEKYISDGGSGAWADDEKGLETPKTITKKDKSWLGSVVNSFQISGADKEDATPIASRNKNLKKRIGVVFEKSEDLMSALKRSNTDYVLGNNGEVVVKFEDKLDYDSFCRENFNGNCKR